MTSYDYSTLKEYWVLKINALLAYKGVNVIDLTEPYWEIALDGLIGREAINQFAIDTCKEIYAKATRNVSAFPNGVDWEAVDDLVYDDPNDDAGEYSNIYWKYHQDWEDITQYYYWLLDALEYNPNVDDYDRVDTWKNLRGLLNGNSLEEIINDNSDFHNKICQLLGITTIPANWETQLVDKIDFDAVNAEKATLQAKADEYDRIHAKLSGQISDGELDNLLSPPPCPHADYDNIKNERDTARTNLTNTQTDLTRITGERDTAINEKNTAISDLSAKELAIVERIITDCELGNDTEKTLNKVIVRIKELIKDNDDISSAVKNEAVAMSKELGLSNDFQTKISQTTTYSNLIGIQKEAFSSKLSENKSEISKYQTRANWAIGLGSLSFGAALILTYFLLRKKQQDNKEETSTN